MECGGRSAVITGAASGIGLALARELSARGAQLILADIDRDELRHVASELSATSIPTDVSEPEEMEMLAAAAPEASIVCLNAGVLSTCEGPVWEAPAAEWERVLRVNLGGVINGLRAFMPQLLNRDEDSHLLITGSLAGLTTWPGGGPYAASKHAVVAVAEQTALALADSSIKVTLLCPALVRSRMSDIGDDPAKVAAEAIDALGTDRFTVMPEAWAHSVLQRGERLSSGAAPQLPVQGVSTG